MNKEELKKLAKLKKAKLSINENRNRQYNHMNTELKTHFFKKYEEAGLAERYYRDGVETIAKITKGDTRNPLYRNE